MAEILLTRPTAMELLAAILVLAAAALILLILLLRRRPSQIVRELQGALSAIEGRCEQTEREFREELARSRQESAYGDRQMREEMRSASSQLTESLLSRLAEIARLQKGQLDSFSRQLADLTALNAAKLETLRASMEARLLALQADSAEKLDRMRHIVDEKLQSTLEKRLGESFKQVSERLEQVYAGLGEMRTLAAGVGDLKKVLTNVKTRGTWGEVRLSHILEQILTAEQYAVNVATRPGGGERVEFAIRLPGPDPARAEVVWLPIDAKFPQEDYQRLLDAQEAADRSAADRALKSLEQRVKLEARAIREKYIEPPHTTDFGILFLPVEGLYAEVLRIPGLCDLLQREHRIVVAGPTTLAALLNSLQMGFRTLAVERRSSEVWELLGIVKNEFAAFGDTLAKTKKKLQEAAHTIDRAEVRTRAIERKLRRVEETPLGAPLGRDGEPVVAEDEA
ncbi:MAG: DNA recombination protein RmuC [Desulfobacterales bacterium]|jgi:DNA recombination protein RmuC|nr:DNA recombination protein RmuC [Desulfobacterales bacterium]